MQLLSSQEIISTIFYIIAVASFSLIILPVVMRLSLNERATRTMSLYLALGVGWSIGAASLNLDLATSPGIALGFQWLTDVGQVSMPVVFGALTLAFLNQKKVLYWYWGGSLGLMVLWIISKLNLYLVPPALTETIPVIDSPQTIAFGLSVVMAFSGTLVTLWAVRQGFKTYYQTQFLNKLRYWIAGTLLLVVANVIMFTPQMPFPWLGPALKIIGVLLVAYVVILYHPPDLTILTTRLAQASIVTLLISGLVFGALTGAYLLNQWPASEQLIYLTLGGLAVVVGLSIPRLYNWLNRSLHHVFFGRQRNNQIILETYSQYVGGELSLSKLCQRVLDFVLEETGANRGGIFLIQPEAKPENDPPAELPPGEQRLYNIVVQNMPAAQLGPIKIDDPWRQKLAQVQAITHYDVEFLPDYQEMPPQLFTTLNNLQAEVYIPIVLRHQDFLGVLALGPKAKGTSYQQEELSRLSILMSQTALDIDKVTMFTQLDQVNQQLAALSTEFESVDQGKSDFLSIASHELRTPLTQIHGYAAMLVDATEEELTNPAYLQQIFQGIAKGSTRLKDVVDVIFEVSKAELGELDMSWRPVSLPEIINQALSTQEQALEIRQQHIKLKGIDSLPLIRGDGKRLEQVMVQLINNAIKYTPDGGQITITGRPIEEDGAVNKVKLVIADTGIGINKDDQTRIFEKFYRVGAIDNHSTGTYKFKGAGPGLGLTLVKGVVQSHGGKVWVESLRHDEETFPGSQFHILLPLEPPNQPEKATELDDDFIDLSELGLDSDSPPMYRSDFQSLN